MSEPEEPAYEGKKLRSGKIVSSPVRLERREVAPAEMHEEDGETSDRSVEELKAHVDELQQKLSMAESAIDDKDAELHVRAVRDAQKRAKEETEIDFREAEKEKGAD